MDYQTYTPHADLESIINCYWSLEVPAGTDAPKQRIVADGCIEMAFILGDDIKRYTSDTEFVLQPRAMVLGHTIAPFYIEPVGRVNTFAIRFYPYGFANFIDQPLKAMANKETPLADLFGTAVAHDLQQQMIDAATHQERIGVIEKFLRSRLSTEGTIDQIVKSTVDALLQTKGSVPIKTLLQEDQAKRRQLERKFIQQIGISPKQLGKVIRMQTALKRLLSKEADESLTDIAYESAYYDQAHFIKDFKEFIGTSPGEFLEDENHALSALFYK